MRWLRRKSEAPTLEVVEVEVVGEPFATVGSFEDFEDELRWTFADPGRRLFDGGPSVRLLELGSVAANPWFVEPQLRAGYVERCRARALPPPLDLEAARRVAWAFANVFADGWPLGVLEEYPVLDPVAYCQHSSLVLELHSLSVDELVELRSRPCRSGWSFALDSDYQQLYTPNDGRNAG